MLCSSECHWCSTCARWSRPPWWKCRILYCDSLEATTSCPHVQLLSLKNNRSDLIWLRSTPNLLHRWGCLVAAMGEQLALSGNVRLCFCARNSGVVIQLHWLSVDVSDSEREKQNFSTFSPKSLTLSGVVVISMSGLQISTLMFIRPLPEPSLSSELNDPADFLLRPSLYEIRNGFVFFSSMLAGLFPSLTAPLQEEKSQDVTLSTLPRFWKLMFLTGVSSGVPPPWVPLDLTGEFCSASGHLRSVTLGIQVRNSVGRRVSLYWSTKIFVVMVR